MATNLHIDDDLLIRAVKAGGGKSKRETVNAALTEYVQRRSQLEVIKLFGTLADSDFWDPAASDQALNPKSQNGSTRGRKRK